MQALVCRAYGAIESVAVEDIAPPKPSPTQVLVTVRSAGVNFPDALIVQGKYQVKPPLPFTPGMEFAGFVKEVGAQVTHLKPGDAVAAFADYGAFAEEAVAEAANVVALSPDDDLDTAAALTMAHGTSLHALKDRARLASGETLVVLGAGGGVGLAAVEIGKLMGARVIAAASSDAKLDQCRAHGADELINYQREDLKERVRALTGGRGADVVYDPVGSPYAETMFRCVAWNGRYLVIGFAAGTIPQLPLNLPLLKGYSVVGVYWGGFVRQEPAAHAANMRQLLDWVARGTLKPLVSRRYPLSRAVDALLAIAQRDVIGKIVVRP